MTARQLKLGDTVVVTVDPRSNNGSPEAAGTVVRVLDGDEDRVNLRVLLDGDGNLLLRNVPVLSKRPKDEDAPKVYAVRS